MPQDRPLPLPNPLTAPYWRGAKEHRLVLPRCGDCGRYHFYPRSLCPHCGSSRLAWAAASGGGEVYSYTVVHRAPSESFKKEVPYVVAIVALAEGPHLMTRLVGVEPASVKIGLRVEAAFEDVNDEISLPVFRPAQR